MPVTLTAAVKLAIAPSDWDSVVPRLRIMLITEHNMQRNIPSLALTRRQT